MGSRAAGGAVLGVLLRLGGGAGVGLAVAAVLGVLGVRWDTWSAAVVGAALGALAAAAAPLLLAGTPVGGDAVPELPPRTVASRPAPRAAGLSRALAQALDDVEAARTSSSRRARLLAELARAGRAPGPGGGEPSGGPPDGPPGGSLGGHRPPAPGASPNHPRHPNHHELEHAVAEAERRLGLTDDPTVGAGPARDREERR